MLYPRRITNPAANFMEAPDNHYASSPDPRFPYVLSTYRLTEHHTAGGMSRYVSHLAELQPELFCEISTELAAELDIRHGSDVTVVTPRGVIHARAMVTSRITPLQVEGRTVHQVRLHRSAVCTQACIHVSGIGQTGRGGFYSILDGLLRAFLGWRVKHFERNRKEEIVQSIDNLMVSCSQKAAEQNICCRCGNPKEAVDAVFWLYCTSTEWKVRLPMCGCDLKVISPEPKPAIQSAETAEISNSPIGKPWRELYKEAVFENDREKLTARIDDAEESLLARARELFHAGGKDIRERQEVDAALYAL